MIPLIGDIKVVKEEGSEGGNILMADSSCFMAETNTTL